MISCAKVIFGIDTCNVNRRKNAGLNKYYGIILRGVCLTNSELAG